MSTQRITLKVSPDPSLRVAEASNVQHQPLLENEPFVVIGAERNPPIVTEGVKPSSRSCFGPRGGALMGENGPFWLCDTGHHRLLGWRQLPKDDQTPADWVIGQPTIHNEGRNGKGDITAATVNVPTGICVCGDGEQPGMAVADAWNHRVLIWKTCPEDNNTPADIVVGQADFNSGIANRGQDTAAANSMHWPYGVAWLDGHLLVADAENRRVLIWKGFPENDGQPADFVLGQHDFNCRDENAGGEPNAMSMRWPHGIALWQGHLCVSDAGNNRIMVWKGIPNSNGAACEFVLGQKQSDLVDHNQSLYWPRANSLNMPYAIAAANEWLLVADTANSRLLGWHIDDLATDAAARALTGQLNFHQKGDNRWRPPVADSLCWPYGIQACGNVVVVADSGNNRVSLWKLAV
ncbi:hypothetical protein [Methyloglobulus sp.]|uniref:hypothetical protein n=1 Tax=Methyloglobulus sp. TaxID=2518622 RepID=UPI003988D904